MIARRFLLVAAIALSTIGSTLTASADTAGLTFKKTRRVAFSATATGGMKINGQSGDLTIDYSRGGNGKLKFTTPVNSLKTGIGERDKHVVKYMGTPKVIYEVNDVREFIKVAQGLADKQKKTLGANGTLTVNGQAKPKKASITLQRFGSDIVVQGSFPVDITKHGIEKPCFTLVCMDTTVQVTVMFKLNVEK
ncbi:MAG: YceI family protein [Polyangiaceae bacterium]|nr:YceI family protein [Polyangiaceae bacterium]